MRCILFLSLVIVTLSYQTNTTNPDDEQWEIFKVKYKKSYESEEEEHLRKKIFLANLSSMREHNISFRNGEVTFDVAINEFSDLTNEEFQSTMTGYSYKRPEFLPCSGTEEFVIPEDFIVPDAVDWREKGAVTEVKNQGSCLSCWAFSATGALEGQNFIANKKLVSLSEQNLMDCSTERGEGCQGNYPTHAFHYVMENGGIDTEKSYPYEGKSRECRYKKKTRGASIKGVKVIPSGCEKCLQAAVALGPVSVAFDCDHTSFKHYGSGVYSNPNCSQTELDHAVVAVGYGHDKQGGDYWLLKNSWGTGWGMDGYFKMARNKDNMCGIATNASYPLAG